MAGGCVGWGGVVVVGEGVGSGGVAVAAGGSEVGGVEPGAALGDGGDVVDGGCGGGASGELDAAGVVVSGEDGVAEAGGPPVLGFGHGALGPWWGWGGPVPGPLVGAPGAQVGTILVGGCVGVKLWWWMCWCVWVCGVASWFVFRRVTWGGKNLHEGCRVRASRPLRPFVRFPARED